ncbi:auxin-responsive protein SAUR71-like [Humulus lupulus]|uniref:auxin-responsive protein SAUR71-like n=1 Tax=Humulus lupulus TaxID=3486 RepID=UPI002B408168|nr:auxin-responsive protein SAUR71-like [Humulus lupulus]
MGMRASKLGKLIGATGSLKRRRLRGSPIPLTPRGYVPICVGIEDELTKRFMVRTALFGDAHFSELLYRSAEEYGFSNDGVLRIPCGAKDFEDWITKHSSKSKLFRVKPI